MRHWPSSVTAAASAVVLGAALAAPAVAQQDTTHRRGEPKIDVEQALPTTILHGPAPRPGELGADTGREALATLGWEVDALGNSVKRLGSGLPRRVVACGIDQPGYVVSEITDDGFLRLHAPADPRRHPLWDQFHEGQRVVVGTARDGAVWGVIAVRSTHLWRRRAGADQPITTIDDLWVDVGARSRREAEAMKIALLAPVNVDPAAWSYGGRDSLLAGAGVARRAACAAVVAAATRGAPTRGETVFVLAGQSAFDFAGLSAVMSRLGRVDTLIVVDDALSRPDEASADAASAARGASPDAAIHERSLSRRVTLPEAFRTVPQVAVGVRSTFPGTLVESVWLRDVSALAERVAQLAGTSAGTGRGFPTAPLPVVTEPTRHDSLADVGELLSRLTGVYALSEHEGRMRDAVLRELPAWARARTRPDSAGNLVLSLGPDRDTSVFVAHMDEIGFEVTRISKDGVVSLRTRGGFFSSLWEGQPALLHFETDTEAARRLGDAGCRLRSAHPWASGLPGVFVPRPTATTKQPPEMTAWFGADSAGLAACGVRPGMAVTGVKRALRLAGTRFSARSIDDRAGCAALILALRELDPAKLTHKVIFTWSVREETALGGAGAMAADFGPTVRRVYAVDTFVSSDSPLESHRFAYTPIGAGAVVRALDNSSATPPDEVRRVVRIAKAAGIALQVGTTNGGNDGSQLTRYGAVDVPISWPLRYSHSPAEVIDLVDVRSLARLVATLARQ